MSFLLPLPFLSIICSYFSGISIGKYYYIFKDPRKDSNSGAYLYVLLISVLAIICSAVFSILLSRAGRNDLEGIVAISISTAFICLFIPMAIGTKKYLRWVDEYRLPDVDFIRSETQGTVTSTYSYAPKIATTKPELFSGVIALAVMSLWCTNLVGGISLLTALIILIWIPLFAGLCAYFFGISIAKFYYAKRGVEIHSDRGAYWMVLYVSALFILFCIAITYIVHHGHFQACFDSCDSVGIGFIIFTHVSAILLFIAIPMLVGAKKYFKLLKKYNLPDVDYIHEQTKKKPTTPAK